MAKKSSKEQASDKAFNEFFDKVMKKKISYPISQDDVKYMNVIHKIVKVLMANDVQSVDKINMLKDKLSQTMELIAALNIAIIKALEHIDQEAASVFVEQQTIGIVQSPSMKDDTDFVLRMMKQRKDLPEEMIKGIEEMQFLHTTTHNFSKDEEE